jgi:hypothetical protein
VGRVAASISISISDFEIGEAGDCFDFSFNFRFRKLVGRVEASISISISHFEIGEAGVPYLTDRGMT